ncbi:M56 family metallopeptidase [Dyadobacter luticola]|uniref:M56 family metallopeptidase n=1 Tax=Dyadobacter luticola TaxID=1979387 RepID=A0A5R9KTA8_9BACT|nr:M56 family metallopeptidase [Dyadobacter luticola]TLU99511.1 M56 family metallopeptidase [Dyadobacter luticola]
MTSYLIKSILCSGILIVVYHLFLEREKMLWFNRFYLLSALVFSLVVPLISFEIKPENVLKPVITAVPQIMEEMQKTGVINSMIATAESNSPPDTMQLLLFVFDGICLLLLIRFLVNVSSVLRLKSRCRNVKIASAKLILVPENIVTYTFLNNIFIPEKTFENAQVRDEILAHELAHARQMHSLDVIFIELIHVFLWVNPFLFWYKKAIRLNHEFLADEAVLKEYTNVKSYQLLLLDTVLQGRQMALTSSFNYSITKKRLAMMTKIKNLNRQYIKQGAIAVLAFVLTLTFSEKIYAQIEFKSKEVAATFPEISIVRFEAVADKPAKKPDQKGKSGPGISKAEIDEFYKTIERNTTYVKNKKGRTDPMVRMEPKMEDRMYELFSQMDTDQLQMAADSGIMVFQMPIPVKKAPTPEMFENWKKPEIFGIWINEKHVPNSELNKYKYSDIAEYSLSKLYGGALKGRIYKYQLDILTNEEFDRTYDRRANDRVIITRVGWVGENRPKSFAGRRI